MTLVLAAVAAFFAVAAFGVLVARWSAQEMRKLTPPAQEMRKLTPPVPIPSPTAVATVSRTPAQEPDDPLMWIWWRSLGVDILGLPQLEILLSNGETWRGRFSWKRYPDGASYLSSKNWGKLKDRLESYVQQIEWKTDEANAKHYDRVGNT